MSTNIRKNEKELLGRGELASGRKKGSRGGHSSGSSNTFGVSNSRSSLARSTRNALLGSKTIKDPFDDNIEQAIKDFHAYVVNASPDEINLEECSLLLQASTKIFGMSVKVACQHVNSLAAFVTNTAKVDEATDKPEGEGADGKKKRGRKKKDVEAENKDGDKEATTTTEGAQIEAGASAQPSDLGTSTTEAAQAEAGCSNVPPPEPGTSMTEAAQAEAGCSNVPPSELGASTAEATQAEAGSNSQLISELGTTTDASMDVEPSTSESTGVDSILPSEAEVSTETEPGPSSQVRDPSQLSSLAETTECNMNSTAEENSAAALPSADESQLENTNGGADGSSVNSTMEVTDAPSSVKKSALKRALKLEKAGLSPAKKRRLNFPPPPTLISIFDLDDAMSTEDESDDDLEPPLLYPEIDLWDGQGGALVEMYEPSDEASSSHVILEEFQSLAIAPDESASNDIVVVVPKNDDGGSKEDITPTPNEPSSSVQTTCNGTTNEEEASVLNPADIIASSSAGASGGGVDPQPSDNSQASGSDHNSSSVELPVLTSDDQQEIQNCIYQLHYLPFTCELTKAELARTFSSTVEHLETIYKKYNMPFNRNLLKAATVACRDMVSSLSARPSIDMEERVPEEVEAFSQGVVEQAKNPTDLSNSEKTILERTREKSVAESRKTIQKRLEEMQKLIVPKYIQWPLITENTPEFFQRVKQFEQKMKKVLADEEKKESFDVSKYEIEVLNATALEAQEEASTTEMEGSDDGSGNSPKSPCPLDDAKIQRMLSPVSLSNGPTCENGKKWVPLSSVFNHMKNFTRNECARHFYAVLALLSSQNLDMNYDRHFSKESAALVTKKLDRPQDPQVVSRYPRGVKIMTSRCPDADKEEIYVTALAAKSCNASFRDLISNEMNQNGLPDGNQSAESHKRSQRLTSSVSNMSNGDLHTESDEEFVPIGPATFTGNLFGGRKKRKKE